ncbi:hypothetical protein EGX59_21420 [Escherichia coli]|nr:hypothetical protein [Escherichia coli]EFN7727496.1 hypothetical protein [Escherichia coli]EFN7773947.1 hypothetical protein [Escherichia coli]EFN7826067.1 hypothetical protein [Escherichia coli]EFN8484123.1 hypothetical protein [Escherichia coli]
MLLTDVYIPSVRDNPRYYTNDIRIVPECLRRFFVPCLSVQVSLSGEFDDLKRLLSSPTIIIRSQTSDNMVYTEKHISIIGVIAGSHYSSHWFI